MNSFNASNTSLHLEYHPSSDQLAHKSLMQMRFQRLAQKENHSNSHMKNKSDIENIFGENLCPKFIEGGQSLLEDSTNLNNNVHFFTPNKIKDPSGFSNDSTHKSLANQEEGIKNKPSLPSNINGNVEMNCFDSPKEASAKKINSTHHSNKKSQVFNELSNLSSFNGFLRPIKETYTKDVENDEQVFSKKNLKNRTLKKYFVNLSDSGLDLQQKRAFIKSAKPALSADTEKLKTQLHKNSLSYLNGSKDEILSSKTKHTPLKVAKNNSLKSLLNPSSDKKINLVSKFIKNNDDTIKSIIETKKNSSELSILEKSNGFSSKNPNKILANEIKINTNNNIETHSQENQVKKALFRNNTTTIHPPKSPINSIQKYQRIGTGINKNNEEIRSNNAEGPKKINEVVKSKQSQLLPAKNIRSSSLAIDHVKNYKEVIQLNFV